MTETSKVAKLLVKWSHHDEKLQAHTELANQEKAAKKMIQEQLQEEMESCDPPLRSAHNGRHRVSLTTKSVVTSVDWDLLYNHIRQTGAFELLHRRVSINAAKDAMSVPGVQLDDLVMATVTKVPTKRGA